MNHNYSQILISWRPYYQIIQTSNEYYALTNISHWKLTVELDVKKIPLWGRKKYELLFVTKIYFQHDIFNIINEVNNVFFLFQLCIKPIFFTLLPLWRMCQYLLNYKDCSKSYCKSQNKHVQNVTEGNSSCIWFLQRLKSVWLTSMAIALKIFFAN